jgi:hypothetical protein
MFQAKCIVLDLMRVSVLDGIASNVLQSQRWCVPQHSTLDSPETFSSIFFEMFQAKCIVLDLLRVPVLDGIASNVIQSQRWCVLEHDPSSPHSTAQRPSPASSTSKEVQAYPPTSCNKE